MSASSPNASGQAQPMPPMQALLKPEQVRKAIPTIGMSQEQGQRYITGVESLWRVLNAGNQESPEYKQAYQKLAQISSTLRVAVQRKQQEAVAAAQQNGARPASQAPQAQQSSNLQAMTAQGQGQADPAAQAAAAAKSSITPAAFEKAKKLVVMVAPAVQAKGQEAVQKYISDAKQAYARYWSRMDAANSKLEEVERDMRERQSQGKPITPQDQQLFESRKAQCISVRTEAQTYLEKFHESQRNLRQAAAGGQGKDGGQAAASAVASAEAMRSGSTQNGGQQPHSISSALDAARTQVKTEEGHQGAPNAQAQPGTKMEGNASNQGLQAPRPAPGQQQMQPDGQPYPLSHQDAMQQARNAGPQAGLQPNSAQGVAHGHPQQPSSRSQAPLGSTHNKMPVPKDLNIPPPQPVSMGPSRPTMTNGPHMSGPIGQPVIQKHPGYVLEGDIERVLSKKKLEELVRQVTGETGAEGDTGETVTAEVEETLLQVADDFVDQVIVSACKLAKLRNSSTLELRDLQLILERNYNIRVPGFASDEVRAVRKVVPSTAWTQKLNAVQAAKVTAGAGKAE